MFREEEMEDGEKNWTWVPFLVAVVELAVVSARVLEERSHKRGRGLLRLG